jgi:adenine phosphoribosyltransferase
VRDVADFPKPGVTFRDLTPVLADEDLRREVIDALASRAWTDDGPTVVAGVEARGFLFGVGVAERLRLPFVPLRKPGKLPWKVVRQEYNLEYGNDALEVHTDAFGSKDRVLIVDDVLATGGTAVAAGSLVGQLGAEIAGFAFVVELAGLGGRARLATTAVSSVLTYI